MTEQQAQLCIDQFYPALIAIATLAGALAFFLGVTLTFLFLTFFRKGH